jgi:hypothetical protein
MRLRTGAHHLAATEAGMWQRPVVPRDERLCLRCTRHAVEDELLVLSECHAYAAHEQNLLNIRETDQ